MLVFILFSIFIVFSLLAIMNLRSDTSSSSVGVSGEGSIAVISINGVIMKSDSTVELLHEAEKNKNIKAIILRVDSPGGAVAPTQEIYSEIRRIDKEKPIYASFSSIAASGGYYLGAATRKIYANPGTMTGSIGVIMSFANMEKLYEFVKIEPEIVKAGKYKDIGSPARKMTLEEKSLMNDMIQGVHQQFMDDILITRKDKLSKDIKELAQGQIFSGEQAKKFGLVDELDSLWGAGRKIHKELKLTGEFGLRFLKKKKDNELLSLFKSIEESASYIKGMLKLGNSAPLYLYQK